MRILNLCLFGFCLLFFAFFASTDLALPGPQYDEASHACLTVDMLNPQNPFSPTYSFYLLGRPLPFGTDPHTGASKAYLLLPFFSLFGPSVEVQRGVTLLMGALALLFCYLFVLKACGSWPAFWTLLLLSLDSAFIFYSKLDAGPIIEKLMWMMFCLWSFGEWGRTQKKSYLLLGVVGSVIGMYSHIAFIWFTVVSLTSVFLFYRKEILDLLKRKERFFIGGASIWMFAFFFYWLIGARDLLTLPILGLGGTFKMMERLATQGGIIPDVLGDTFEMLIQTRPLTDLFFLISVIFLLCFFRTKVVRFLMVMVTLLFIQMSFTPGAILPHRIMMLYVFFPILGGVTVAEALRILRNWKRSFSLKQILAAGVVFLAIFSMMSQILFTQEAIHAIHRTGGTGPWSDEIYRLADFLREERAERAICIDWGFRKNLFLLTKGALLLEEPFWRWEDEKKMEEEFGRMENLPAKTFFLLHPRPYGVRGFPTVHQFKALVTRAGKKPTLRRTFYEKNGRPIYLVYTLE